MIYLVAELLYYRGGDMHRIERKAGMARASQSVSSSAYGGRVAARAQIQLPYLLICVTLNPLFSLLVPLLLHMQDGDEPKNLLHGILMRIK